MIWTLIITALVIAATAAGAYWLSASAHREQR
jgi:hypothetical protein